MLPGQDIAANLCAMVLIAAVVCMPGYPLVLLLPKSIRVRNGFIFWPLMGVAYWAVMLYLLPFRGGLLLSMLIVIIMLAVSGIYRLKLSHPPRLISLPKRRSRNASIMILGIGCAVYFTPLFNKHVPDGMDASRYIMNARLIALHAGLPKTLAPFAPDIPFGAANHGLPAVASIAVMCGATPAAATLACLPLAYVSLILGTYLLTGLAVGRISAAFIAVAVCWLAKQSQQDIVWGGFTGVFTLGMGLVATRLLIDSLRGKRTVAAIPVGLCIGCLPILHGCMAAGWLYIGAPAATIAGLLISRRRSQGMIVLLIVVLVAGAIVSAYAATAWNPLDTTTRQWIIVNELHDKFPHSGLQALGQAPRYLIKAAGTNLTLLIVVSFGLLALCRRWRMLTGLAGVLMLNLLTIINAGHGFLPATLLLYPSRLREFPILVAGLAVALAWRVLPVRFSANRRVAPLLAAILLFTALLNHGRYYQSTAWQPVMADQAWDALNWCSENLDPREDYVATAYGTAGAYLPGVAGIAATNWHAHIIAQSEAAEQMRRSRPITHYLSIETAAIRSVSGRRNQDQCNGELRELIESGTVVDLFNNGPVTLYKLNEPG